LFEQNFWRQTNHPHILRNQNFEINPGYDFKCQDSTFIVLSVHAMLGIGFFGRNYCSFCKASPGNT